MSIRVYVATSNEHKRSEIEDILEGYEVRLIDDLLAQNGVEPQDVPETQKTFTGNAKLKSEYYTQKLTLKSNEYILADDSGLMVDALDGMPGVRSKRFATPEEGVSQDDANNRKLLDTMEHMDNTAPAGIHRGCKYVCAISIADQTGEVASFVGEVLGEIGEELRGSGGFGYDPVFMLPNGNAMAEVSPEHKNSISHRYKALQQAKQFLDNL